MGLWHDSCKKNCNIKKQNHRTYSSSMIRESFLIRESLLNKKLWIFDSQIRNDSRINLKSNHFKKRFKSTFSLRFSKKIATRFVSRIIDSDSRQALISLILRRKGARKLTDKVTITYSSATGTPKIYGKYPQIAKNVGKKKHKTCRML